MCVYTCDVWLSLGVFVCVMDLCVVWCMCVFVCVYVCVMGVLYL